MKNALHNHHYHHTNVYRLYSLSVTMSCSQVKRSVISHVGGVHPRSPSYQHLQDLLVPSLGRPVKRGELVVIPGKDRYINEVFSFLNCRAFIKHILSIFPFLFGVSK